jgi:glycosyltransferase involved in cell wall biosynthesis
MPFIQNTLVNLVPHHTQTSWCIQESNSLFRCGIYYYHTPMTQIDIILPYFKGSKFIEDQLKSISENDLPSDLKFKILIIDDSACNNEHEILTRICSKYSCIEILRNSNNIGVIKSIDHGLQHSTADYVMLCDQDDYWLSQKIWESFQEIRKIEKEEACLVFTDLKIVNEKLNIIHESMFQRYGYEPAKLRNGLIYRNIVTGCTIILNRKLIELTTPFPENVLMHDHWLALCATYGGQIGYLRNQTILYRQHANNQIGARYQSVYERIRNFKKLLEIKVQDLKLKSQQALNLHMRLRTKTELNDPSIYRIGNALQLNDYVDFIELIHGKFFQYGVKKNLLLGLSFLLILVSKKLNFKSN